MIVRALIAAIAVLGLGLALVMAGPVHAQTPDAQNIEGQNIEGQRPDVAVLVDAASGLYELGDYRAAAQAYEDVVALGVKDPVLYYNLGVAYLQTGRPALAVLNFRRTLAIDPADEDAQTNLDLARQSLDGDYFEPTSGLTNFSDAVTGAVPAPVLGAIAFAAALAAVLGWVLFRASRLPNAIRDAGVYFAAVLVLLVGFAVTVVVIDGGRDAGDAVLPRSTALYSGPDASYVDFLKVPAGMEVSVVDERDEWLRVALPSGEYGGGVEGWAKRSSVELVLP
jgi:hypothetical protein